MQNLRNKEAAKFLLLRISGVQGDLEFSEVLALADLDYRFEAVSRIRKHKTQRWNPVAKMVAR